MWFLNKVTGVKWFIVEEFHKELLKQNNDYEIVEKIDKSDEDVIIDNNIEEINLDALKLKELQELAKENDVKSSGLKKEELIESLREVI